MLKSMKEVIQILIFNYKFLLLKICRRSVSFLGKKSIKSRVALSSELKCSKTSRMKLGKIVLMDNTHLVSASCGELVIGDDCFFNRNCIVVSQKYISIGKGCSFGPNVCIYDHDHIYGLNIAIKDGKYKSGDIIIGNNVWVGAGTIILRGTVIEDNCVIGAGTVIKEHVPANTLVVPERDNIYKEIN